MCVGTFIHNLNRFVAKTYAYLGPRNMNGRSDPAEPDFCLDNHEDDNAGLECQPVNIVGHYIGGTNRALVAKLRKDLSSRLYDPGNQCGTHSINCPRSLYCGLSDFNDCINNEKDPEAFAFKSTFRMNSWCEIPPKIEVDRGLTAETPYAYIEFSGRDAPYAACAGLNAILFQTLTEFTKPGPDDQTLDVRFLSDYQCSSEIQARVLMFCHFRKFKELERNQINDPSKFGLDSMTIRPITYKSDWLCYATALVEFFNKEEKDRWKMQEIQSAVPDDGPVEIRISRV